MILDKARRRRTASPNYKTTTIRQFDGGWNVIDNELTLSPRYARILDNMQRGSDGSVSVRPGYGLWKDLRLGTETTAGVSVTFSTTAGSRRVVINWTAHGLVNGNHVSLSGTPVVSGIPNTELNRTHSIRVIDANSFDIITSTPATATATTVATLITATKDTHLLGGDTINGTYFQDNIIVVDSTGEIVAINGDGVAEVIWSNPKAFALTGSPFGWGATTFVSFHVFGGKLLVHNGVDKPLDIDLKRVPYVIFLGDPASGGSNTWTPIGRIGYSAQTYAIVGGKSNKPSELAFSADLAAGVWVGNPTPDDAVDVDMSKRSVSFETAIVGIGELRDKLLVAFRDSISIGSLGITKTVGTSTLHDPQFKDNIPQHGCISHRSIVSLGNDVFMCDRVGVPSVAQSQISGQFTPDRVSDLIEPALQTNIGRLTDNTLRDKVFAIFNPRERQYMLFMPRFDPADDRLLSNNPITVVSDLELDEFIVYDEAHGLEPGDPIHIDGVVGVGSNPNSSFNGDRTVYSVLDDNTFTVRTGSILVDRDVVGGGAAVYMYPKVKETIGYIFAFNPKLKVRAWSRFRQMDFDWALKTAYGQIMFGKGGKIYRYGNQQYPYSADKVGDYDKHTWLNNTSYLTGVKVLDDTTRLVYQAKKDHVSPAIGTFAAYRNANPDVWEEYYGNPIKFVWEWPWGDFDKRLKSKAIGAIYPDTMGTGQFDIQLFVDELYKNDKGILQPVRSMTFTASQSGGYGAGDQPFGGGRRTREQLLWPVPVIGKLVKLRIEGETTDPLRIIAISIIYKEGSMKR